MKETLAINFGKYLFGPKTPFHWKKVFFMTLRSIFKVFWVKILCSVRKRFSISVIYMHFSHCRFSLFVWIYWVRFKTRLAKGPILELAAWTAKSAKSKSLIYARRHLLAIPCSFRPVISATSRLPRGATWLNACFYSYWVKSSADMTPILQQILVLFIYLAQPSADSCRQLYLNGSWPLPLVYPMSHILKLRSTSAGCFCRLSW